MNQLNSVAMEWWLASGERSQERLESLMDHFLTTHAIEDAGTRAAFIAEAIDYARHRGYLA